MRPDLQRLVSEPREDLAVEYKTWLDLSQEGCKAVLAKACIALANHGGGFLVLGFEEQTDGLASIACPAAIGKITQDDVNAIIRRYADPEFHCELYTVTQLATEVSHPVVAVPSEASVPIMSRRDCSNTIRQHACYVRKPGPRSEEPRTAEEWRTLFQRCIRANRENMLSSIRSIVLGRAETGTTTSDAEQEFGDFRATGFERWQTLTNRLSPDSPQRMPDGHYEFAVQPVDAIPAESLAALRDRLSHARRIQLTGWPPFVEMDRDEWRPYAVDDHIEAWVGQGNSETWPRGPDVCDYWRASRKGQLYTVRGYTEDSLEERQRVQPGTVVDVTLPVWRIGEALYFAARFFDKFERVRAILINCRFTGLSGRTITSISPNRWTSSRPCRSDHVETTANIAPPQLQENVVEIVHQLLSPLYEAFDFYTLSRTLVEEELGKLRRNRF